MHWNASLKQKLSRAVRRLRKKPYVQTRRFGYEKAGLQIADEPIPWNAETVWVEATIQVAAGRVWGKEDFHLHVPDRPPLVPTLVTPADPKQAVHVVFRMPPPQRAVTVGLYGEGKLLDQMHLPFLSAEEFLRELRLESPVVCACLGPYSVTCRAVVEGQCRGYSAGAILVSPTSLLPIIDMPVRVDFINAVTCSTQSVTVPLANTALVSRQAVLSVVPPRRPLWFGKNMIRWSVADRQLGQTEIHAISPEAFRQSLYLVESRCLSGGKGEPGATGARRLAPGENRGLRPCFLVASREPGVAGLCPLEVRVRFRHSGSRPVLLHQDVLVTDGPSPCLPDRAFDDDSPVLAFELYHGEELLGVLTVSPAPSAYFTSEGGFQGLEEYTWTRHADEELMSRLQRLMAVGCTEVEGFPPLG
jgi:hypothetical protein